MPITPPAGYITRAQAPKHYSRSKRTLERDLDDAYAANDVAVLSRYLLVTKDDKTRLATEITTADVKNLMADGMVPTWCIQETYLQRLAQADSATAARDVTPGAQPAATTSDRAKHKSDTNGPSSHASSKNDPLLNVPLPDDVEYLKARVGILEREKEEQQRRHDETVGKLWHEMHVKNDQIKSWDEVTQALTKGLATGQITPNLSLVSGETNKPAQTDPNSKPSGKAIIDATVVGHESESTDKVAGADTQDVPSFLPPDDLQV